MSRTGNSTTHLRPPPIAAPTSPTPPARAPHACSPCAQTAVRLTSKTARVRTNTCLLLGDGRGLRLGPLAGRGVRTAAALVDDEARGGGLRAQGGADHAAARTGRPLSKGRSWEGWVAASRRPPPMAFPRSWRRRPWPRCGSWCVFRVNSKAVGAEMMLWRAARGGARLGNLGMVCVL